MRAEKQVAVGVGGQQRHVSTSASVILDAEEIRGVGLQIAPGRHAVDDRRP